MKLLIVDDHKVVRRGLILLIKEHEEITEVFEAANGVEALEIIKQNVPDIVLTDITMPEMNGIELTREIAMNYPNIKVLVLSMHQDEEYILNALDAGAMGYVAKDSDEKDIHDAITDLLLGNMYYSGSVSHVLAKSLLNNRANKSRDPEKDNEERLTARELEVLTYIVNGYSNKEIGNILSISNRTVDTYRNNTIKKLGARNTADLVRIAMNNKLV